MRTRTGRALLAGSLFAWLGFLLFGLTYRPLWLDELLHLQVATSSGGAAEFLSHVTRNAGATPLTYVPQYLAAKAWENPEISGRLPAFASFAISILVFWRMLRRSSNLAAWVAAAFLAVMPLAVRYAIEARPYSLLLLLAMAQCALCLRLAERVQAREIVGYVTLTIIGVYVLPIFIVVPLWHAVVLAVRWLQKPSGSLGTQVLVGPLAVIVGGLSLLPWYLYASPEWSAVIRELQLGPVVTPATGLMLLREITGGGYLGLLVLTPLLVAGIRRGSIPDDHKLFWLSGLVVPTLSILAIDLISGYFVAIRQFIFVLIPLCSLSAFGAASLITRSRKLGTSYVLIALLVLTSLSARWILRPGEDWAGPAKVASDIAKVQPMSCIIAIPLHTTPLLAIAAPAVKPYLCDERELLKEQGEIIIVDTGYSDDELGLKKVEASTRGRVQMPAVRVGTMKIERYVWGSNTNAQ